MIIAAIDIGSNAGRLLIKEVNINSKGKVKFTKLNMLRMPLRLGIDVFTQGKIGKEREQMTLDSMKVFSDLMKIYKVEHYRACATSAMRDAKNGDDIRKKIKAETGINIEIISGDEEANLIYENHFEDNLNPNKNYLYIDVGGGSTELMFFENNDLKYKRSFNIGTLRLLNNLVKQETWEEMKKEIKKHIISDKPLVGIGSGGNINKIFSLSKTKEGKPISTDILQEYHAIFSEMSVEKRMSKFKLRRDRADVIVPALMIFNKVVNWTRMEKIYVPKISVADGLIKNIYKNLGKK
ncbi:MAG: exopolyphosphatase [Flavobacteriales bacterium]|nr:MAG: exopolyphosphatase [Flavobacteriales bacterium]